MLSDILARSTDMPVQEVQDGMVVAANQLYVIPPDREMVIQNNRLCLRPRQSSRAGSRLIDVFFKSLAKERGNRAIGVVLSGADADGTLGIGDIKGAGGITFAQSEDTAQVPSMPRMAIATGQVDFVLPPADIGRTLGDISRHPYLTETPEPDLPVEETDIQEDLNNILRLLRRHSRVDFSQYKDTTIKRRIFRRMALHHISNLHDYRQFLKNNTEELEELYQEILIRVTSFFRDSEVYATLAEEVFPSLVNNRDPDDPIRVWVAGCSTGEEAYSIAICLLEYIETVRENPAIQIFATDVNETTIEYARNGWYSEAQVADVSPERLQRYFVSADGGYQINTLVRELCVFARHNLSTDPPFSQLDLISCRNVLIYFGQSLQRRVLPMFHYGLKRQGFLLLGVSESVGDFTDLFAPINGRHKLYSKQPDGAVPEFDFNVNTTAFFRNTVSSSRGTQKTPETADPCGTADQIILNRYGPTGVVVNAQFDILQFRGQTGNYLDPSPGRASLNLLRMVKESLRLDLRTCLYEARQQSQVVNRESIILESGRPVKSVRIEVLPFTSGQPKNEYFLVTFSSTLIDMPDSDEEGEPSPEESNDASTSAAIDYYRQANQQLQDELDEKGAYLQSIIQGQEATNQELRAANEEILSSNEELQSTNEELQTAKEEIQATNEELSTINEELYRRNAENARISDDFQNLLGSIRIPILMLDQDLRIRRFTPTASSLFNLIGSDVGRPFSNINHQLRINDLEERIRQVIDTLEQTFQEVQDQDGNWYDLRIRPYRTLDNRIDGAVVILVDISDVKRKSINQFANEIVQTVRQALVVLDGNLQVLSANEWFYQLFQVTELETEGCSIFELGNGQWDIPQLRSLLEEILPQDNEVKDFEVIHEFETIGPKIMRLNARRLVQAEGEDLILLAIEEVSES
jgi:two-component system CheB/CheR fusion protein